MQDISDWERGDDSLGSNEGFWVSEPQSRRLGLLKFPRRRSTGEILGHVWAEYIATQIGLHLGVAVANTEIVVYSGKVGVISFSVLEGNDELRVGADLGFEDSRPTDLQAVWDFFIEKNIDHFIIDLVKMIWFDALLGVQDRHIRNWGVITRAQTIRKFSPLFDNASSLGAEMNDTGRSRNMKQMDRWVEHWRHYMSFHGNAIGWQEIKELGVLFPQDYHQWKTQVSRLSSTKVRKVISDVPSYLMTDTTRNFVEQALLFRCHRFLGG